MNPVVFGERATKCTALLEVLGWSCDDAEVRGSPQKFHDANSAGLAVIKQLLHLPPILGSESL